tara:strand:- start:952 stop:1338 length:387 start_codon:yes stop_codon:yes gene_type:complete
MTYQKLVEGVWVDTTEDSLIVGEQCRVISEGGGWTQKAYLLPVAESVIAIRKISKRAFMQRFTQPERTLIRNSTDDIVIDIYEDLKSVNNVNLDMTDTLQALAYLESLSIISAGRPAAILVDGTIDEV